MAGIYDAIATENPEWLSSSEENAKRAEVAATEAANSEDASNANAAQAKHYMELAAGVVTGVALFNERFGAVYPKAGDYTAAMVNARSDTWVPAWNDVTGKPDVMTLSGSSQTATALISFKGLDATSGNSGLVFGTNNSLLTSNPNTGDVEIIHGASKAVLGLQVDGVIFAKTSSGDKYRYYTEANPFPLATTYKLSQPASAATQNINAKSASVFEFTLTAATTAIAMTNYTDSESQARQITMIIHQDIIGARKVTWDSKIRWSQGRVPVLSMDAGVSDVVTLLTTNSGNTWYGFFQGGWLPTA